MDLLSENKAFGWCGEGVRAPGVLGGWPNLCCKVNSPSKKFSQLREENGYSMKSQDLDHFLYFG